MDQLGQINEKEPDPPDALVVIATGCPHCPQVVAHLVALVAEGVLGSLEIINATRQPDRVAALGVRGVPWTQLGPFILDGVRSREELRQWIARSHQPQGMAIYFDHLFAAGRRQQVEAMIRADPTGLEALVLLLGDPEVGINTRLGVGVVLEELATSGLNRRITHGLGQLTLHGEARIRGDACHYLPQTLDPAALDYLRAGLADPNHEVREIAMESMEILEQGLQPHI